MSPETAFQKFVRDALTRIEERLEDYGKRMIVLEINQKSLLNGRRDMKTFWMRIGASVVVALILVGLGVLFGKSL